MPDSYNPDVARPVAVSLNPEAGMHAIPSDPRELDAAIRAAEICWRRFPYFEWRYGERGRRFASSDSAWLVTLCEFEQDAVDQNVAWLGQLLAARGMPRIMLESHLAISYEELVRAVPERAALYDRLRQAAQKLSATRLACFDERATEAFVAEFEKAVGQPLADQFPGVGLLLVAAVADEKAGVENAVQSLASWLTEPDRFPQGWIEAVQSTIQELRGYTA